MLLLLLRLWAAIGTAGWILLLDTRVTTKAKDCRAPSTTMRSKLAANASLVRHVWRLNIRRSSNAFDLRSPVTLRPLQVIRHARPLSSRAPSVCVTPVWTAPVWFWHSLSTLWTPKAIIVVHRLIRSLYTGRWWVGCYIWYSEDGDERGRAACSGPSSLYQM